MQGKFDAGAGVFAPGRPTLRWQAGRWVEYFARVVQRERYARLRAVGIGAAKAAPFHPGALTRAVMPELKSLCEK